ncbi:uracil-xanthine permease family protein [Fusobacterium sp. PH5-44]|uniref:uracil-xanthine permease family protein n=1 Tax=unclassified Fusobacterium TaxID=2648384 RepID=UPI003D1BE53F
MKKDEINKNDSVSVNNIYKLDGRVPLDKAIPFGLQHVLAMFVANITPIFLIAGAANLDEGTRAMLIQNAMFIAGIGTLIQLYPLWKIGAKLPIVMGVSFTFVTILSYIAVNFGYSVVLGAVLVGGIIEGTLGLFAKYWRKIITPVVASSVVITIGYSLLGVGARSFAGGYNQHFGSMGQWLLGTSTLVACLTFNILAKSFWKQLSVLFGLIVGYIIAFSMGIVDMSNIFARGYVALPKFMPFKPEFNIGAIVAVTLIFMVSAAETIGDTTAMVSSGLDRDITEKEISGSLACDGFASSLSSLFGCLPVTSFSQNVGLIAMTKVVNRFTIMTGAAAMILAGIIPPIGGFFATLPDAVLGGCTIMMFGSIMVSGVQMLAKAGFTQRNIIIVALSLSIGIGFTQESVVGIFAWAPELLQKVLSQNCVAIVFIVSLMLSLILPKNMDIQINDN